MRTRERFMLDKRNLTMGASVVVLAAALAAGSASAQSFDTSAIAVDETLAARVPADIKEAGVLVGGSDNAYAPWEYLAGDDGQTPEGIDIDLMNALTAKLGLTYESRTADFSSILPALGTNYDVGVSAFSITNERMNVVNFVTYANTGSEWGVKAGNPTGFDPADYCGRVIALQSGTWHEEQLTAYNEACVAAGKPAAELLPFALQTEATTRVAAGGADATISGAATIGYAAMQSGGTIETLKAPDGVFATTAPVGIAVTKADTELTQLIADTLNAMIYDGTYQAVLDHWGVGSMALEEAVINPEVDH